jgi:hypothetical protein
MPVFTVRHRALKAAVWKNETENGPMFNTTLSRSYKDGETWKESGSFGYAYHLPRHRAWRVVENAYDETGEKAKGSIAGWRKSVDSRRSDRCWLAGAR